MLNQPLSDLFDSEKRSWIMSRVRNRNTRPELIVRSLLHRLGYRFRLHRKNLPGHPDIVLPKHRKVIFVHGCFWHGHEDCPRGKRPTSNIDFWRKKIARNRERDHESLKKLEGVGWKSLVIWQCETRDGDKLGDKLLRFLEG